MSLYTTITGCHDTESAKKLFGDMKLKSGYAILSKVSDEKNLMAIAKYASFCYDAESPLHEAFKNRKDLKKSVIADISVSEVVFEDIVDNKNKMFNQYIKWYWEQTQDYYRNAIITLMEIIEQQLEIARMKIDKGEGEFKLDDDKYLKAANLQNTCMNNAIENIKKLEELKNIRLKKHERSDDAILQEVFEKSGTAEQQALLAIELKKLKG